MPDTQSQMKRLLLISNSTLHGSGYLDHAEQEITTRIYYRRFHRMRVAHDEHQSTRARRSVQVFFPVSVAMVSISWFQLTGFESCV